MCSTPTQFAHEAQHDLTSFVGVTAWIARAAAHPRSVAITERPCSPVSVMHRLPPGNESDPRPIWYAGTRNPIQKERGIPLDTRISYRSGPCALLLSVLAIAQAPSAWAGSRVPARSAMAPIRAYLMPGRAQEIALARTAAPPAISMHATVLVLGAHGYFTAVPGRNGFVCLVTRSWDASVTVNRARFWNPNFRIPMCFNAQGSQTVLAEYLRTTGWALAGASRSEIGAREKAAWADGTLKPPGAGAICYMMSKDSWGVGGNPGPWRPHLMFYFPARHTPNWGANLPGTPVLASVSSGNAETRVMVVVVPFWSDGSPAPRFHRPY